MPLIGFSQRHLAGALLWYGLPVACLHGAIASYAKSNRAACFKILLCVPRPGTSHPAEYTSTGCAFRPHLRVTYGAVTLLLSVLSGE